MKISAESQGFTPTLTNSKENDYLKEEVISLNNELAALKEELNTTLKKLVMLEEEAKATPKKAENKRIPYQVEREIEQQRELNSKLSK
jgi:cell division protein FtsB